MKTLRFCILIVAIASLLSSLVYANEIYLPTPEEVGDLETSAAPPQAEYASQAQTQEPAETEKAPYPVHFGKDILLPTAVCIAVASAIFATAWMVKKRKYPEDADEEP